MKLMVVESPNKIKKISELLGPDWTILASAGHIRDLPKNALGVDKVSYRMDYEFTKGGPIPGQKGKTFPGGADRVARIRTAAASAEMTVIATDPDREGEAIAWHIVDALSLPKQKYARATFDSITRTAIDAALASTRQIDTALVHAQEARRCLDRLIGYQVSPVLSQQLGTSSSAGRVQTPALRLVVEREKDIRAFKQTNHFGATLTFDNGAWSAQWVTKAYATEEAPYVLDEALAAAAAACRSVSVTSFETGEKRDAPPSPFSTSLLLQAASVALKLSPAKTAKVSQSLFEQGLITYHRTDSVNYSAEALASIQQYARSQGLPVAQEPRRFKTRGDAQEAHEAIRPTHLEEHVAGTTEDERALYTLIWQRTVASQLEDAVYRTAIAILDGMHSGKSFTYKSTSRTLLSPGWRSLTADDPATADETAQADLEPDGGTLPSLAAGEMREASQGQITRKKTTPPSRFTQATLIKKLEACGIGRPSTYPAIMSNIIDRGYVTEQKRMLIPSQIGEDIIDALVRTAFQFIDITYTSTLENSLDAIAAGKATYIDVVNTASQRLDVDLGRFGSTAGAPRHPCPACGKALQRRLGTHGHFWGCTAYQAGCKTTLQDKDGTPFQPAQHSCPTCAKPMRRISGSKGYFWGCSGYKEGCKTTRPDKNGIPA